jgi:hypothetical protein
VTASQAGDVTAPAAPNRKLVNRSVSGEASLKETAAAKAAAISKVTPCMTIRSRRASTMSVKAPAGKANKNIGSVVATWTSETAMGCAFKLVISQGEAVSNIARPTFDIRLDTKTAVKAGYPKTPHREGAMSSGAAAAFEFVLKPISIGPADLKRRLA